jgi:hypothetical protein
MGQASTVLAPSPLHAEACALLLAPTIARLLQLQQVTFLKDNLLLAMFAAARKIDADHVNWEIREAVANYIQVSHQLQPRVFHISRSLTESHITVLIRS